MNTLAPQFLDFRTVQGLLPRFGKRSLESLVDQEFAESYERLSVAERAFFLERLAWESPLLSHIQENQLSDILDVENNIAVILSDMEHTGVAFDAEAMREIGGRIRADIATLETVVFETIGERINLNSPKQLQHLFFERLGIKPIKKNKTGFSVDTDVLEEIAKTHHIAKDILEYRSLSKLASTYVDGLLKTIDLRDGRIHTTYDSTGTTTGRMSSNDPNLQNIPTGDGYAREIKSCFVASPGNILLVADYSQIELRILAFLSQDAHLLGAFMNGEDIHMRTAQFLFGEKEITANERRIAKSVNFGVIYGITGFGLSKTLGCSPWEAQKYVEAFYEKYPNTKKYYDTLLENARNTGFVETFFGRRRYVPGVNDANKTMRAMAEREAMNMPIQGTAADILKLAMIEIYRRIQEEQLSGKMILQVHDELVFDVPLSEREVFENMIVEVMEGVLEHQKIRSIPNDMMLPPMISEVGSGYNWADAK